MMFNVYFLIRLETVFDFISPFDGYELVNQLEMFREGMTHSEHL